MSISVTDGQFSERGQAAALIEAAGLYARDGAMQAGDLENVHWHKTSLMIYVLDGAFETRDVAADKTLMARSGDVISIPAGTLHAARCPQPATYVVGFESSEAAAAFRPEQPDDLAGWSRS